MSVKNIKSKSALFKTPAKEIKEVFKKAGITITKKEWMSLINDNIVRDNNYLENYTHGKLIKSNKKQVNVNKEAVLFLKKMEREAEQEANEIEKKRIEFNKRYTKKILAKVNKDKKKKPIITDTDFNIRYFNIDNESKKHGNIFNFITHLLKNIQNNNKYLLRVNDMFYTLNDQNRFSLIQSIKDKLTSVHVQLNFSDADLIYELENPHTITLKRLKEHNEFGDLYLKRPRGNGAFFKYNHKTQFDLSRYQIYTKNEFDNNIEALDQCLIYALKIGGLEIGLIEKLVLSVKNRNIPKCEIEKLCDIVKIQIIIKYRKPCNKIDLVKYGKTYDRKFNIGLIDEHYFINEKTNMTSFCLNNYELVKDKKECNLLVKINKRDKRQVLDSFDIIELLIKNKDNLLEKISFDNCNISSKNYYDKVSIEITDLNYDEEKNCEQVRNEEVQSKISDKDRLDFIHENQQINYTNVFFDSESNPNDIHEVYLARYTYYNTKTKKIVKEQFIGPYCIKNMLQSITFNCRLIAHNAGYDYRFLVRHLFNVQELNNCGNFIEAKGMYKNFKTKQLIHVQVKDSYKLISSALSTFPKLFNLKAIEKEVMPYKYYTSENIKKRYCKFSDIMNHVKDEDKHRYFDNCIKWKCFNDDYLVDIIKYSSCYCDIDCELLMQGYNIFRQWILKDLFIDIDFVLTSASLAHQYFVNQGCYDGVFKLSGTPQLFIQGSIVGGRVMCANNEKDSIEEKVQDFDAVSLYPSAMKRIEGFLLGKPKIIKNFDYDVIQEYDGYFVDILIKSIDIKRTLPLMSYKDSNGRNWTNDMEGRIIRVDKTTLEDFIEFHGIKFNIIRGYYFDEGFNNKINDVIQFLFSKRLELKDKKNKAEMIYKLIMNSGYGKSITKPVDTVLKIIDKKSDYDKYILQRYNWIKEITEINDEITGLPCKWKIKEVKPINEHFNICHVGSSILSMSKRIMNEVICLAEDNKIDIYYQDTDSMHIKDKDIKVLEMEYILNYDRQLIGKEMGQFHSDFDFKDHDDVYASRSIFLGKKSYIDELKGKNKEGKEETEYHIKMKGIPNKCILHTVKTLGYNTPFELYEDLYKGKAISFDLTCGGEKANFKKHNNYTIETLKIFNRTVKFN